MLGNHHGQMSWSNLNHGVICLAKPTSQWWRSLRMPFQAAFAELLGSFSDFSEATLSVVLFIVAGPIPPLRFAVTPQGPACGTPELVTRNQQAVRLRHAGRCVMLSWLRLSARRFKTRQHHGLGRRRRCVHHRLSSRFSARRSRPHVYFRPPESVVSFALDVFSIFMDMFADVAEQRPTLHQCILSLNCACIGKTIGALETLSVDATRESHIQTYSIFVMF